MSEDDVIPPAARLLRDFVNTSEPQTGEELLTSPDLLRDWFAERRILRPHVRLRAADLDVAVTVREGLRAVLLGHAGHPADPAALQRLDQDLAEVPVRVTFSEGGYRIVAVRDTPLDHALAALLDAVRQCGEDQSWTRLKACVRETCRWAYFDTSRNQSRRWCSMAGCGNYVKMRRAYAARTRGRKAADGA